MITTNTFFKSLFSEERINFRFIKVGSKSFATSSLYNNETVSKLDEFNNEGYDLYFVVNNGGYSDDHITQLNAVFIDLDCGRNPEGNYRSLDEVNGYKERKLKELEQFALPVSWIIDTRNGLQCYWLLRTGATIEQFKKCEERLVAYFDADKKAKNPSRLMRVPNYFWCKANEGLEKYFVKIISHNEASYGIEEIIRSLPEVKIEGGFGNSDKKKYSILPSIADTKSIPLLTFTNTSLIEDRNIDDLQRRINPQPVILHSHEDVSDFLRKQDLNQYLGLYGDTFCCLFHNDKNPSAGIIRNKVSGHFIYNCQSSRCGWKGTIVSITERLLNCTRIEALRFLRKLYKVEYVETKWQKEHKEILEENQRLIMSSEFQEFYTIVHDRIRASMTDLHTFIGIAKDKVFTEYFTDDTGNPIFFISSRHLARLLKKDDGALSKRISLFTYLGLVKKLREDQIPPYLLERAKHEAAKKKQKNIVNFYSIPSYGELTLSFSVQKAKEFKEKNFTMKGWCREMLLRALSEEETNRVFPQLAGQIISEKKETIAHDLEKIAMILIGWKGWTTETEVMSNINALGNRYYSMEHLKCILPEFLDKYCLVRCRLNKVLKEELNISLNSYPYILVKDKVIEEEIILESTGSHVVLINQFLKRNWIRKTDDTAELIFPYLLY
jgi:hypothetical protein